MEPPSGKPDDWNSSAIRKTAKDLWRRRWNWRHVSTTAAKDNRRKTVSKALDFSPIFIRNNLETILNKCLSVSSANRLFRILTTPVRIVADKTLFTFLNFFKYLTLKQKLTLSFSFVISFDIRSIFLTSMFLWLQTRKWKRFAFPKQYSLNL